MGIFDSIFDTLFSYSKPDISQSFLGLGKKSSTETATGPDKSKSTDLVSNAPASSSPIPESLKLVQPGGFFKYGHPGPRIDVDFKQEYISAYDRRLRNPFYVVEHVTPTSLAKNDQVQRKNVFMENESIPLKFRARLTDYFRSGYDRGHMAPARDAKYSQEAMDETFYLTNMAPQVGDGFNRDYWAHFEEFCRSLTGTYNSVRIVTGPLYLPKKYPDGKFRVTYEMIGNPPSVAVPTHFFKLIVAESPRKQPSTAEVAVGAFILPNEPIPNAAPLKSFYVPVDAIERASGLEFLTDLAPSLKKDLCREVQCEITVREFVKALPAPRK
ncbi:uncharacterized protein V1516DRAFT_670251 [Lipomyces oligophaga]|uniref:uncharacterized protein n=1 Tax=Lipomyces oligophaga TaxID=45792 RepID=UPI0034CEC11C